jgi:hypothetical protein
VDREEMRPRSDDEMSHDDEEWSKAGRSPEFARISLINQTYKAGFKTIEEWLASLPEERQSKWRKVYETPLPKRRGRPRKPKREDRPW